MNHSEKAEYHDFGTKYLNDNQVREKFQRAMIDLLVKQPEQPLDFLIQYFRKRKKFLVFSVLSILDKERENIVQDLAGEFNLKVIKIDPKLMDGAELQDNNDYSKILDSLHTFEANFDGIIFDNFPCTKVDVFHKESAQSSQSRKNSL